MSNDTQSQALDAEEDYEDQPTGIRGYLQGAGATGISMLVHILVVLALALVTLEQPIKNIAQLIVTPPPEEVEDPPVEIELDPDTEIVPPENIAMFTSAPVMSIATTPAATSAPALDQKLVERADAPEIKIDAPTIGIPDSVALIEAVPDGDVKGEVRDVVDSYAQAVDRLAQELIWMLDQSPVLAVWVFDQSESMKDDQQEIRDRIQAVYEMLGLNQKLTNNALLTAITSYGADFIDHTRRKPTADGQLIAKAIDSVPIDRTGEEMMCAAVGKAITTYRDLARRGRKMAIILVTDESGNRVNNERYLEETIRVAKLSNAKIYVLGRESVFGYPFAYIRWRHPQTKRVHWLRVDRGPETGFPEQLQTNGLRRRFDAFSSGFGPYEQARMARETNGIFFMLPSVETNLVGAFKERYDLDAMRPYRPDLSPRDQVLRDRAKYPLRSAIWKVIQDLNPYAEASKKTVELRTEFSLEPAKFLQQARQEQAKAKLHLGYMAEAEKFLISQKKLREQEADPRWQANYDIILAQLVAYQARVYEYGVGLEAFIRNPKTAPMKKGNQELKHWDLRLTKKTRTEEAKPYIERATEMFAEISKEHPGSPWSARAKWEMRRGFGCDVVADYDVPYVKVKNPIPVPKL